MPFEIEFKHRPVPPERGGVSDRKLGDEWADWNGELNGDETEIDEPKSRFLLLSGLVILGLVGMALAGWYLMEPRLLQLGRPLRDVVGYLLFGLGSVGLLLYLLILIEVITERISLLPYRISEKILLWLLPRVLWTSKRLGISKDRLGNSFIKVNNSLIRSYKNKINHDRLLILLPRCLNKEIRQGIRAIIGEKPYSVFTVGGGEEARKVILKQRPTFIIALACERDLMSGIKDVAPKIPVIGIPNKRPEGPCKNTHIDLQDFREAIRFFQEGDRHGS